MDPFGAGLAGAVGNLSKPQIAELNAAMAGLVPDFHGVGVRELVGDGRRTFFVKEAPLRGELAPASISDGTVRLLGLVAFCLGRGDASLLSIEEIENGLHPFVLQPVVELLRKASKSRQVLVTTHSAAVLDHLKPNEVLCAEKRDGATVIQRASSEEQLGEFKSSFTLGELFAQGAFGGAA